MSDTNHSNPNTPSPPPAPADQDVTAAETVISLILRVGVVLSLGLIVLGLVVAFAGHGEPLGGGYQGQNLTQAEANYPRKEYPRNLSQVWDGLIRGRGQAFIAAGLLLLILTPVIRVAASAVLFARQRDWMYVLITLSVLLLLIVSLLLGGEEQARPTTRPTTTSSAQN